MGANISYYSLWFACIFEILTSIDDNIRNKQIEIMLTVDVDFYVNQVFDVVSVFFFEKIALN